jgi:hypothetical protein
MEADHRAAGEGVMRSKKGTPRTQTKLDPEMIERANQVAFMIKSDHWPRWPLLPMKRHHRGHLDAVGFLVTGKGPVIHRGSMYQVEPGVMWDSFSREMYESFDALYAAGWRID